jgi:hypothetical protein
VVVAIHNNFQQVTLPIAFCYLSWIWVVFWLCRLPQAAALFLFASAVLKGLFAEFAEDVFSPMVFALEANAEHSLPSGAL